MTPDSLSQVLDAAEFDGLAIDKQPTGFTASILIAPDGWSPYEFATSPSEAVVKCVRKWGRPVAPPSRSDAPAPLCPPPY
jgi:hypothetical protein